MGSDSYRIFVDHCRRNACGGLNYSDCVCDHCMKVKRGELELPIELAALTAERDKLRAKVEALEVGIRLTMKHLRAGRTSKEIIEWSDTAYDRLAALLENKEPNEPAQFRTH